MRFSLVLLTCAFGCASAHSFATKNKVSTLWFYSTEYLSFASQLVYCLSFLHYLLGIRRVLQLEEVESWIEWTSRWRERT